MYIMRIQSIIVCFWIQLMFTRMFEWYLSSALTKKREVNIFLSDIFESILG